MRDTREQFRSFRWLSVVLALSSAVALGGCGGDDDDSSGSPAPAGSSGGGGSSAGGSAGTSGGSGGNGGSAGASDGTAPCGAIICQPTVIAPACCTAPGTGEPGNKFELVGREPNKCGTDLSAWAPVLAGVCLQLNQPGVLDSSCPELPNTMPGQPPFQGCCTEQGFCGGFEAQLPLGCNYSGTGRGHACGAATDAGTEQDAGW